MLVETIAAFSSPATATILFALLRLAHGQLLAFVFLVIEFDDRLFGFIRFDHFDITETP